MAGPGLCQLLDPRKGRSLMQINTALHRMGFATWNDVEPGKDINFYFDFRIHINEEHVDFL